MEKLKFTTVEVFDKLMMILTTDTPYILTPDGPEINIQWCQHFGSHDLTFADSAISTVPVPSVVSASSSVVFSVSSSCVPASSVLHVASAASASSVASAVSVTSVASATSASSASSASSATSSDVSAFPSSTVASDASSVASVSASDEDDWSDEEDISVPIKRTP